MKYTHRKTAKCKNCGEKCSHEKVLKGDYEDLDKSEYLFTQQWKCNLCGFRVSIK